MISATWSVIFKTVLLFYMNLSSACLFSIRQLRELLPKITFQPSLLKRRHNLSSCFGVAYLLMKKKNVYQFVGNKTKRRILKRVFQENKARQLFRKTNISYVYVSGGKKRSFFAKFGVLCFLETHVLRFAFLPYHQRIISKLLVILFNILKHI